MINISGRFERLEPSSVSRVVMDVGCKNPWNQKCTVWADGVVGVNVRPGNTSGNQVFEG